jgi:hypothetical protein
MRAHLGDFVTIHSFRMIELLRNAECLVLRHLELVKGLPKCDDSVCKRWQRF